MNDDNETPPERPLLSELPDDNTGKIRLIAQHEVDEASKNMVPRSEVNGFFTSADKYFKRAKLILAVVVAIGSVGWGFGLWVSGLAKKLDIIEMSVRLVSIETWAAKSDVRIQELTRRIERRERRERESHIYEEP